MAEAKEEEWMVVQGFTDIGAERDGGYGTERTGVLSQANGSAVNNG